MAKSATGILSAAVLLGLLAAALEPAAAASSSSPVTLRGTGPSAAPANSSGSSDRSSIVLRGSTPPPTPSFAGFPCPPGYTYDPDTGCIVSGGGSGYSSEPEYDWWYWPNDYRRRPFRPHRHAATGFARGSGLARGSASRGMPVAHGFAGGHR